MRTQALSGEAPDVSLWFLTSPLLFNSLRKPLLVISVNKIKFDGSSKSISPCIILYKAQETILNTKKNINISFPLTKCGILGWFLAILGIRALSNYVKWCFDRVRRYTQAPIQTLAPCIFIYMCLFVCLLCHYVLTTR